MKEQKITDSLLRKYGFKIEIAPSDRRRIEKSKRRAYLNIVSQAGGGIRGMSTAVRAYLFLKNLGFSITPLGGLRFAQGAAVFSAVLVLGLSFLTYRNQLGTGFISAKKEYKNVLQIASVHGAVDNAGSGVKVNSGDDIEGGSEIRTGKNSSAVINLERGAMIVAGPETVFSLMGNTEKKTVFSLKRGFLFSRVKSPYGAEYTVASGRDTVTVKGTSFAVSSQKNGISVEVLRGTVVLKKSDPLKSYEIQAGRAFRNEKVDKMNPERIFVLKKLDDTDIKDAKGASFATESLNEKSRGLTLEELGDKYGRIDIVTLYNGKKYRGVILSRGGKYKVLTPRGIRWVGAQNIKNTKTIRK